MEEYMHLMEKSLWAIALLCAVVIVVGLVMADLTVVTLGAAYLCLFGFFVVLGRMLAPCRDFLWKEWRR